MCRVREDQIPLWMERLESCEFFQFSSTIDPAWSFVHARFAELMNIRQLFKLYGSAENVLLHVWGRYRNVILKGREQVIAEEGHVGDSDREVASLNWDVVELFELCLAVAEKRTVIQV